MNMAWIESHQELARHPKPSDYREAQKLLYQQLSDICTYYGGGH